MSSKILLLMRHAKPASDASVEDFFIPLSPEGIQMQKKLSQKLDEEGFLPEKIYTSPFQRAKETAEIVAQHFKRESLIEEALGEPFDVRKLIGLLEKSDADQIAFIGHGPSLTLMANLLLGKDLFKSILPKSSAVIIEFQGEIKKGSGTLLKYLQGA